MASKIEPPEDALMTNQTSIKVKEIAKRCCSATSTQATETDPLLKKKNGHKSQQKVKQPILNILTRT